MCAYPDLVLIARSSRRLIVTDQWGYSGVQSSVSRVQNHLFVADTAGQMLRRVVKKGLLEKAGSRPSLIHCRAESFSANYILEALKVLGYVFPRVDDIQCKN